MGSKEKKGNERKKMQNPQRQEKYVVKKETELNCEFNRKIAKT